MWWSGVGDGDGGGGYFKVTVKIRVSYVVIGFYLGSETIQDKVNQGVGWEVGWKSSGGDVQLDLDAADGFPRWGASR